MDDHTGTGENNIPQMPGLNPHAQSVHMLVQAWKVCVMHRQQAPGCHHPNQSTSVTQSLLLMYEPVVCHGDVGTPILSVL